MERKIHVDWDTDGYTLEECGLPSIVEVPSDIEEEDISDWLSDEYGFCVNSWWED